MLELGITTHPPSSTSNTCCSHVGCMSCPWPSDGWIRERMAGYVCSRAQEFVFIERWDDTEADEEKHRGYQEMHSKASDNKAQATAKQQDKPPNRLQIEFHSAKKRPRYRLTRLATQKLHNANSDAPRRHYLASKYHNGCSSSFIPSASLNSPSTSPVSSSSISISSIV